MITRNKLSTYRQTLRELMMQIEQLAFKCAHQDTLIHGTPGEVFRTCGKKSCKCSEDKTKRHGPYPVIQIVKHGKQKQIALKKNQRTLWQKAKNYQLQKNYLVELKEHMKQLENLVKKIIQARTEEFTP